jgi:hypothetical protein
MDAKLSGLIFVLSCGPALADDATKPASSPAPSETAVNVKPGDSWEYEIRDGLTDQLRTTMYLTVTEVTTSEIDVRYRWTAAKTQQESSGLVTYDRNWRRKEDSAWRETPPNDTTGIPDGLAVNKSWNYTRKAMRLSPPQDVRFTGSGKVPAWEEVTLPNGASYDAYRIEFTEAATPVVNNRKSEYKTVEWYAPSVNNYVKRTWEFRQNGKLADKTLEFLTQYKPLP